MSYFHIPVVVFDRISAAVPERLVGAEAGLYPSSPLFQQEQELCGLRCSEVLVAQRYGGGEHRLWQPLQQTEVRAGGSSSVVRVKLEH